MPPDFDRPSLQLITVKDSSDGGDENGNSLPVQDSNKIAHDSGVDFERKRQDVGWLAPCLILRHVASRECAGRGWKVKGSREVHTGIL